jgi:hypothetical protein
MALIASMLLGLYYLVENGIFSSYATPDPNSTSRSYDKLKTGFKGEPLPTQLSLGR